LGREAAERFPEADQFYKKNVVPAGAYVSPGLRRTIEQGINPPCAPCTFIDSN